jgi:hypothetical protein
VCLGLGLILTPIPSTTDSQCHSQGVGWKSQGEEADVFTHSLVACIDIYHLTQDGIKTGVGVHVLK